MLCLHTCGGKSAISRPEWAPATAPLATNGEGAGGSGTQDSPLAVGFDSRRTCKPSTAEEGKPPRCCSLCSRMLMHWRQASPGGPSELRASHGGP